MDDVKQKDRPSSEAHSPQERRRDDAPANRKEGGVKPEQGKPKAMSLRKRLLLWIAGLAILSAAVIGGVAYWLHARNFESTDDAFIDGNSSKVAARISGQVVTLFVSDNDAVKAGQPLFDLDPSDHRIRLAQAEASKSNSAAQASQARADLLSLRANLEQDLAQVRVAEADQTQARQDLARFKGISSAAVSRQQFDQSSASAQSTSAKVDSARQAVKARQAQVVAQQAKIDAADASLRQASEDVRNAELQLSYTHVVAPQAGRITQRSVNVGNYVSPGQALLSVVPDQLWATANFKETQLTHMRVGQPVKVRVDAFPDDALPAHVESLQRGTGSFFSTLPAENATGNYVKVVQRVPVKIVFDGDAWRNLPLAPGMSVVPQVTVR